MKYLVFALILGLSLSVMASADVDLGNCFCKTGGNYTVLYLSNPFGGTVLSAWPNSPNNHNLELCINEARAQSECGL